MTGRSSPQPLPRGRVRRSLLLLLLAGCDGVFGLDTVSTPHDAPPVDTPDAPARCPFADNFDDNALDARWHITLPSSSIRAIEQHQHLEVILPDTVAAFAANRITTTSPLDLTDSSVEVTVTPMNEVGFS